MGLAIFALKPPSHSGGCTLRHLNLQSLFEQTDHSSKRRLRCLDRPDPISVFEEAHTILAPPSMPRPQEKKGEEKTTLHLNARSFRSVDVDQLNISTTTMCREDVVANYIYRTQLKLLLPNSIKVFCRIKLWKYIPRYRRHLPLYTLNWRMKSRNPDKTND